MRYSDLTKWVGASIVALLYYRHQGDIPYCSLDSDVQLRYP